VAERAGRTFHLHTLVGLKKPRNLFGGSRPIYHQAISPSACWVMIMIMIITLTTNKKNS
jgi:hypothetical protein